MIEQPVPPGLHARATATSRSAEAPHHLSLSAFALRAAVAVLVAVAILLVVYLMWRGVRVLVEAFAGVLFAVFLTTLSGWVSRFTKLRHGLSLALVVATLIVLTAGFGWLSANRLTYEAVQMKRTLPASLERMRSLLDSTAWGHYLLELFPQTASWVSRPEVLGQMSGLLSGVVDFLVAVLVIFFVGLFGAAEPDVYRAGLLHLVPPSHRDRAAQTLDTITANLRWWLAGQVFLMISIGFCTGLGLWLLGIPLALVLGVIAGFFELVPFLGPWLSFFPAALLALLIGPWHVVFVALLFLGIHILEGYVLGPLVQRRAVRLSPALTLVAQVLLGTLFGLLGLFVAAPLTAAVIVGLKMLYVQDTLGDSNVLVSSAARQNEAHGGPAGASPPAEPPERQQERDDRPGGQDSEVNADLGE